MQATPPPSTATGCLSQFGLLVLVALGALLACGLATLLPPWVKVDTQRQQVLYWSQRVEDRDSTFAGYHWLLAGNEWQTETAGPSAPPPSGEVYDVTEYRIFWRLLFGEWIAITLAAASLFVLLARRLNPPPPHT